MSQVSRYSHVAMLLHWTIAALILFNIAMGWRSEALLHDPLLLILDEPTDGLDPNQRHAVRDLIRKLGEERGLIISTHSLEEVEAVCTRAIVIDQGRIVADKTPAALIEEHGSLERAFYTLTRGEERA